VPILGRTSLINCGSWPQIDQGRQLILDAAPSRERTCRIEDTSPVINYGSWLPVDQNPQLILSRQRVHVNADADECDFERQAAAARQTKRVALPLWFSHFGCPILTEREGKTPQLPGGCDADAVNRPLSRSTGFAAERAPRD